MPVLINTKLKDIPGLLDIVDFIPVDIFSGLPYKVGLLGSYFLSSNVDSEVVNYANRNLPLIKHGSPVLIAKNATCDHSNFYDTQITSKDAMTMFTIAVNALTTTGGSIVSNYDKQGAVASGDSLFIHTKIVKSYTSISNATTNAQIPYTSLAIPDSDMVVAAGVQKLGVISASILNPATNELVTATGTAVTRTVIDRSLRIGTTYSDTEFYSPTSISVALIYEGDIGSANILSVCQYLRNTFGVAHNLW